MKEKSKGGTRSGAGRKPSADPKQPITIFVKTSIIDAYGGKEAVRLFCYNAIEFGEAITSHAQGEVGLPDPKKKFPPSDQEVKQKGWPLPKDYVKIKKIGAIKSDGTVIKDATGPVPDLKPQEHPKANFPIDTRPKTLDELKSRCPAELKGIDRTIWISEQKEKYGI
jgi:hypothetical protein